MSIRDINIPTVQRQWPTPSLKDIEGRNRDRKKGDEGGVRDGSLQYQQIGKHLEVHFTTVGRVARETKGKLMSKRRGI